MNLSQKVANLMKRRRETTDKEEKEKFDNEIGKQLLKEKYDSVEKQMKRIKANNATYQSQVFKLRNKITNNDENSQIQAIMDPETENLIFDKKKILRTTLEFASGVLQNNHPVPEFEQHFEAMKRCHRIRMSTRETDEEDLLSEEDFNKELKALKIKGNKKYKEITDAGEGFKKNVFDFFKLIWNLEIIPASWNLTTLIQIFKRGRRSSLSSYRFVHLKTWMPRMFDGIVFSKMKEDLVNNMSKFQIGAKPGHRAQEHIFVLFSILELFRKENIPLIIQTWDVSRYFDSHTLLEAQEWLADCSVPKKCYRLMWKLNDNTTVQVKTAAGVRHSSDGREPRAGQ